MIRGSKAFPEVELEIGGETLKIVCDWKTIYNFEKISGRSITSFIHKTDYQSASTAIDFIYSAVGHRDKKFTKDWVCENMTRKIWLHVGAVIIPMAIQSAMLDDEQVEEQKKDLPGSQNSSAVVS